MSRSARPVYLNLFKIRLPVPGVVSFLHRVSGVLLVLFIPVSILVLERSLAGAEGYAQVRGWLGHPLGLLLGALFLWSLMHHLLAGIRFLLLDLDIGMEAGPARVTARVVLLTAIVLAAGLSLW
ncbi:MAG TPA: succinate dehydrogenase, cytochrome b556 subunit, partial [Thioalkalivibrio sp.]|nr:succinate dehydrogenase, cytochrome b556 subunit [Thioalkalivibrio sp.]